MSDFSATIQSALSYHNQCYDSGVMMTAGVKCRFCHKPIREVFLLKDPWGGTHPIGKCCFAKLKPTNPQVYLELVASLTRLRANMKYVRGRTAEQKKRTLALGMEMLWKDARRAARRKIKAFRELTGEKEWLPKPLFELAEELAEIPKKNYKNPLLLANWYKKHALALVGKIENPLIGPLCVLHP